MKKKNLNLESLKIKSFVTGIDSNTSKTAKGGHLSSPYTVCCFVEDPSHFCSQYPGACGLDTGRTICEPGCQ